MPRFELSKFCFLFPGMDPEQYDRLRDDIKENGVVIATGVYITLFFSFGVEASYRSVPSHSVRPSGPIVGSARGTVGSATQQSTSGGRDPGWGSGICITGGRRFCALNGTCSSR